MSWWGSHEVKYIIDIFFAMVCRDAFMFSLLKRSTCHVMFFHCQTDLCLYASLCGTGSLVNGTWVATTNLQRITAREVFAQACAGKKESLLVASETEN